MNITEAKKTIEIIIKADLTPMLRTIKINNK